MLPEAVDDTERKESAPPNPLSVTVRTDTSVTSTQPDTTDGDRAADRSPIRHDAVTGGDVDAGWELTIATTEPQPQTGGAGLQGQRDDRLGFWELEPGDDENQRW